MVGGCCCVKINSICLPSFLPIVYVATVLTIGCCDDDKKDPIFFGFIHSSLSFASFVRKKEMPIIRRFIMSDVINNLMITIMGEYGTIMMHDPQAVNCLGCREYSGYSTVFTVICFVLARTSLSFVIAKSRILFCFYRLKESFRKPNDFHFSFCTYNFYSWHNNACGIYIYYQFLFILFDG